MFLHQRGLVRVVLYNLSLKTLFFSTLRGFFFKAALKSSTLITFGDEFRNSFMLPSDEDLMKN